MELEVCEKSEQNGARSTLGLMSDMADAMPWRGEHSSSCRKQVPRWYGTTLSRNSHGRTWIATTSLPSARQASTKKPTNVILRYCPAVLLDLYIYVCIHAHACIYVYANACICKCYACMYTHVHTCIYIHVHIYICIQIRVHVKQLCVYTICLSSYDI